MPIDAQATNVSYGVSWKSHWGCDPLEITAGMRDPFRNQYGAESGALAP